MSEKLKSEGINTTRECKDHQRRAVEAQAGTEEAAIPKAKAGQRKIHLGTS